MGARVAAPLAFLVLATIGILAIRSALDQEPAAGPPATATAPAETATVPTGTAPPATTAPGERRFYRVRAGDTLESIAERNGTTVEQLLELNPGIDPVALSIGQRIRVG